MSKIVGISVKFTGDDSDLKQKVNSSKQSLKDFEEQLKKLKVDRLGLQSLDIKAKLSLNTEDYKVKHAEIQRKLLELKDKKLSLQIDTENAKMKMTDFEKFANSMLGKITFGNILASGVMGGLSMATQGVKTLLKESIELSSKMTEMQNVLSVVFEGSADDINKWADNTGRAVGRSKLQLVEFAGQAGAVLSGLGKNGVELQTMSKGFAQLAIDMASFWNVADVDAFNALRSAISGETEPMKRFGVVMTDANLSAFALEQGIRKKISAMNEDEKTTLRYNFLMEKTKSAQGNASETIGSYANQVKVLDSNMKNLNVSIGEFFTKPIAGGFITGINGVIKAIEDFSKSNAINKISEGLLNPKEFNLETLQTAKGQTETKLKGAYGSDMMRYESILKGINEAIALQTKLERENVKEKDKLVVGAFTKKMEEEKSYYAEINRKLEERGKLMRDTGSTEKEISTAKLNLLQTEMEKLDTSSEKYSKLLGIYTQIKQAQSGTFGDTFELSQKGMAQYGRIMQQQTDYGISKGMEEAFNDIDRVVYNSMYDIGRITGKGFLETIDEYQRGVQPEQKYTQPYTPRDDGAYYQRLGMTGTGGTLGSGGALLRANRPTKEFEAEYQEFYKNIGKIEKESMDERTQTMKDAQENIADSITKIGNTLNNDFIKALGNVASNIIDIQDGLERSKTGGMIGQIAGGLEIVGAVISIGQTIYDLLNPAADKQMSAAELMEQAVSEFKASLENKSIYQIDQSQKNILSKANTLSYVLASAIADTDKYKNSLGGYSVYDKESNIDIQGYTYDIFLENINKELKTLSLQFAEAQAMIEDSLNISWGSLASSVKSAFDEVDLSNFSDNFEKSMKKSLRNAMIESFLQNELMSSMFQSLSDQMFGLLSSVNFDVSKLTEDYTGTYTSVKKDSFGNIITSQGTISMADIQKTITELTTSGESFYTLLEKLGLGVSDVSDKMTETASALSNVPSGIKLAYKRFEATTATQSTNPQINVYVGNEQLTSVVTRQQATANGALYGSNSNSGVY